MQWLGGIGIIVMAITILPLLKVGGMQLFKMEGPLSTEKILPRTLEVATILIFTYFVLTSLCAFFYWLFGMSIFDSIAHSMTTIATGGFSTHNDSIGFFSSSNIELVASIFIFRDLDISIHNFVTEYFQKQAFFLEYLYLNYLGHFSTI